MYGGLVKHPQMTAWQLLFSHCVLEKCVVSVQIHSRERVLAVLSGGNRGESNMERKNPPKSYMPNLDLKNQKVIPEERLLMRGFFG